MVKRAYFALFAVLLTGCIELTEDGALVPPTVDQDPALPQISIEVAGRTRGVHVETYGDPQNPALFLLHGSLSDFRSLRGFEVLSDRYFVVLWDQRGNGLSERITADEYTEQSIIDEIEAIKSRYSPDRPVTLVGHSFGATYSVLYTARRPANVAQLVLMEPAGLNGDIFTESAGDIVNVELFGAGINQMFWQNEVLSPSDHEIMDYKALMMLLDGSFANYHCDPDHPRPYPVWRPGAHIEFLRAALIGQSGSTFRYDFATGIEQYPTKVLIVAGECSVLGPAFQERYHRPLFADVDIVAIADAGHRLFVEQFDATLAAIDAYLQP